MSSRTDFTYRYVQTLFSFFAQRFVDLVRIETSAFSNVVLHNLRDVNETQKLRDTAK